MRMSNLVYLLTTGLLFFRSSASSQGGFVQPSPPEPVRALKEAARVVRGTDDMVSIHAEAGFIIVGVKPDRTGLPEEYLLLEQGPPVRKLARFASPALTPADRPVELRIPKDFLRCPGWNATMKRALLLKAELMSFAVENGAFPAGRDLARQLTHRPQGEIVEMDPPLELHDAFGRPFQYSPSDVHVVGRNVAGPVELARGFKLISVGADGRFGTLDDLVVGPANQDIPNAESGGGVVGGEP